VMGLFKSAILCRTVSFISDHPTPNSLPSVLIPYSLLTRADGCDGDPVVPVAPGEDVPGQEGRPAPHEAGAWPLHGEGGQHFQECSVTGRVGR
jgi:hypothetical protein